MIMIEVDGELQLVNSTDGYHKCKVIAKDVNEPKAHQHWSKKDKKWVTDEKAKERAKRVEQFSSMDRAELVDHILKLAQQNVDPSEKSK